MKNLFYKSAILGFLILSFIITTNTYSQNFTEYIGLEWGNGYSFENPTPACADINNDGLMDIVCGDLEGGISYFRQVLTPGGNMKFDFFENQFGIPYGGFSDPDIADFDNDGLLDMVVGKSDGLVCHYEQSSIGAENFNCIGYLDGVEVNYCASPALVDVDHDSLLDLVVSDFYVNGYTKSYEQDMPGSGSFTSTWPIFAYYGGRQPAFGDYDKDGLWNFLLYHSGYMNHYEQTDSSNYSFNLVEENFFDLNISGDATFADLDNDGKENIIVGGNNGYIYQYEYDTIVYYDFIDDPDNLYIYSKDFAFTDIDNDGLLDLIALDQYDNLEHYEQIDPNSDRFIKLYDFNIDIPDGLAFEIIDIDNDGLYDLISGNGDGTLYHFEQTNSNPNQFELITDFFNEIEIPYNSSVGFTDIDNDGLLDMILGNYSEMCYHYEQEETNSYTFNLVTDSFYNIENAGNPVFFDINNDGLDDLIMSGQSSLRLFIKSIVEAQITQQPQSIELCESESAVFSVSANGNPAPVFQWQKDSVDLPGENNSLLSIENVNIGDEGYYRCTVDNNFSTDTSDQAYLSIHENPNANFEFTAGCSGLPSGFTDLSTINTGNIVEWNWDFGDGTSSTIQNPEHTYSGGGEYNVQLIVSSDNGCTDAVANIISIPEVIADFTATEECQGTPTSFTDNSTVIGSGNIISWYWDFGDGNHSVLQNPLHTFDSSGNYFVQLTVESDSNCVDSIAQDVYVYENLNVSVFVTASSNSICQGEEVVFTALGENGGETPLYEWYLNEILTGNNSSIFISSALENNDLVYCVLTSSEPCTSNNPDTSNFTTIIVNSLPEVEIEAIPNDTACITEIVTLDAGNAGSEYFWSTTETTQQIEVVNNSGPGGGLQTYWVTVTDNNNCPNTDSIDVFFDPCTVVGEYSVSEYFKVYPNPTNDNLFIDLNNIHGSTDITLISSGGNVVQEFTEISPANKHVIELELSEYPNGLYYLKVVNDRFAEVRKIVKN